MTTCAYGLFCRYNKTRPCSLQGDSSGLCQLQSKLGYNSSSSSYNGLFMLLGGIQSFLNIFLSIAYSMETSGHHEVLASSSVMTRPHACRIELHLDADEVQKVSLLLVPRPDRADALGRFSGLLDGPLQISPGKARIACHVDDAHSRTCVCAHEPGFCILMPLHIGVLEH